MDINHYCEHFKNLKLTKNIDTSQQSACKYCLVGKNYLWMCLAKGCGMFFCERNAYEHMHLHLEESRNKKSFHSIYINMLTAQILCIHCKIQIYDLDQITKANLKETQDPYKLRLKVLPALAQLDQQKNKLMGQLENPEGHRKINKGMTGLFGNKVNHSINSAIQFLMQFVFYREMVLAFQGKNRKLEALQKIFEESEAANHRAISTDKLTKIMIQQNPELLGYSRKDPFEHVLAFLTLLHEKIKFYSVQNQMETCDQWDYLGRPGLTSLVTLNCPLFDNMSISLAMNYQCASCKIRDSSQVHINFLKVNFPKKKRKAKEVEKQLAEHRATSPTKNRRSSLISFFMPEEEFPFTVQELVIQFLKQPLHKDKSCLECKKPMSKKKIHFSNLSEYLIVQINRMGRDGNSIDSTKMQLSFEPIDLGPFTENKNETMIYHLETALCIEKGCLFPVVGQNKFNKQSYIFKNQIVSLLRTEKNSPNPYILCYKREMHPNIIERTIDLHNKISDPHGDIMMTEQSFQSEKQDQVLMSLPDFFDIQLKNQIVPSFSNPLVCHHHYLKPACISKMKKPVLVSQQTYQEILSMLLLLSSKKLGFIRQKKNYNFAPKQCQTCLEQYNSVEKRRERQRNKIVQLQKIDDKLGGCMVACDWVKKWVNFLYKRGQYGYMFRGYPMPGPIDNKSLLDNNGKCKSGLKKGSDYKVVSIFIWRLLKQLYGGGPQIRYKWKKSGLGKTQDQMIRQIKAESKQLKQIYHIQIPDSPKKSMIIEKSSSFVKSTRQKEQQASSD